MMMIVLRCAVTLVLLLACFSSSASSATVVYNTTANCTVCEFFDASLWVGGVAPTTNDSVIINGSDTINIILFVRNHTVAETFESLFATHALLVLQNSDRAAHFSVRNLTLRHTDIDVDDWSLFQVLTSIDADNTSNILCADEGSIIFASPSQIGSVVYLDGNCSLSCPACTFTNGLLVDSASSVDIDVLTLDTVYSESAVPIATSSVSVINGATVQFSGFVYPRNVTVSITQNGDFLTDGWWSISNLTIGTGSAVQLFPQDHVVSPTLTVQSSVQTLSGTGEVNFDGTANQVAVLGRAGQAATTFTGAFAIDGNVTVSVQSPYIVNRVLSERTDNLATLSVASAFTILNSTSNLSGQIQVQNGATLSLSGGILTLGQCANVYGHLLATNIRIVCNGNFVSFNGTATTVTLTGSTINATQTIIGANSNLNIVGTSTINGNLVIEGLLFVDASDSHLSVQGNYIQTATAGLTITSLDTTKTPIDISQNATLNGYLSFGLLEDPTENTTYTVATVAATILRQFATVEPAGGKVYEPSLTAAYEEHAITLRYAKVPDHSNSPSNDNTRTYIIVGCVVGGVLLLGAIVVVIVVIRRRRQGYTAVK